MLNFGNYFNFDEMRKIAIFTSGDAPAAKRVTSLFNEGNRIRIVAVLADSPETVASFEALAPDVILFSHADWNERKDEILETLKKEGVEKFAVEGCDPSIAKTGEGMEEIEVFMLSSEDEAPREVVAAFAEKAPAIPSSVTSHTPSVDEEWAETLKVNFNEESAHEVPPPLPGETVSSSATPAATIHPVSHGMPKATPQVQEPMPPSYLVWSIVTTIFCCLIPGIVAIIFSSQVSTKYLSGDFEGARKSSRNAEIWIIVSFVLGVLSATLTLPIALIN